MSTSALPKLAAVSAAAVPGAASAGEGLCSHEPATVDPTRSGPSATLAPAPPAPPAAQVSLSPQEEPPKSAISANPAPRSPLTLDRGTSSLTTTPGGTGAAAAASTAACHPKTASAALGVEDAALGSSRDGGHHGVRSSPGPAAAGRSAARETVGSKDVGSYASDKTARKLHSRQDDLGKPTPGKVAAPKKQDFAALMAARQQKMREAEESGEGMYFD